MEKNNRMTEAKYRIGIVGLGVMGRNLVLNMAEHGFPMAGYDKDPGKVALLRSEAPGLPIQAAEDVSSFVSLLQPPRSVMLLMPAGPIVDSVIRDLLPVLEPGDLIIDAGNSHFTDTDLRESTLAARSLHFFGMGVSGGEAGARHGPIMMPGGLAEIYPRVQDIFEASANQDWLPNLMEIDIQPDEGIALHFQAKQPGADLRLSSQEMRFRYSEAFQTTPPEAYETLLLDVIRGDATLFMRADQVENAWGAIEPVLDVWGSVAPADFPNYPSGTWGPPGAEALIAQDGHRWLQPTFQDQLKPGG